MERHDRTGTFSLRPCIQKENEHTFSFSLEEALMLRAFKSYGLERTFGTLRTKEAAFCYEFFWVPK
jgi:hypothetical protein